MGSLRNAVRRLVLLALECRLILRSRFRPARLVALTFDDGPDAEATPALLATLRRLRVTATFFLLGSRAAEHPDIVRAIADADMEIGSHSLDHTSLLGRSVAEQTFLILESARLIARSAGRRIDLFRPPYGEFDDRTLAALDAAGQRLIVWNVDPQEWSGIDRIATVRGAIAGARAPAVVLMHDASASTVAAIPGIVRAYRRAGYRFVPVSQVPRGRWERESVQFADARKAQRGPSVGPRCSC